ncbi:DUF803-domain-containing protein [Hortaea werneckii]|nr:DUF803-domain-containing protein [Hortaea werneckii]KAI6999697.1 DUF803-domain-containing protein [Hortaea werneckii]KAI7149697.1 DUF803-domain-containing protein [Hortaea werneckii]
MEHLTLNSRDLAYHAATLALRAAATTDATASSTSPTSTATSTSSSDSESDGRPKIYKIVGIMLAVASGLFIGVSFVLKKVGLLRANVKYNEEAGEGYGYLKNFYWWSGMTLMVLGEICNFVAYAFTDAILVTPLGALSVVITTFLSAIFLKERLSFVGKIGCFLCILGSVIIPLNAPEQSAVADIQEMQHYVITPGFLTYAGVLIAGCAFTAVWVAPRYGKKSMLVYLSICSLIGGLSVVCTQGLGSAILAQINGEAQFNKWFTYVLIVFVIATLLTEIVYLNKALNIFNAALVTPTYYVYFTTSTLVASAILFQGFGEGASAVQIVDVVLGFLTICSGVILLQLAKSSKDVPDAAVFQGDLDQVRTVAEQEEPEYEPRADTIRGGAGIVRALSRVRGKREAGEAHRIKEEMAEAGHNENDYEWDGLRRRKTVSSAGRSATGSLSRSKTVHPPLGMSQFPEDRDDVSDADSEVHPGFFGRIARLSQRRPRTVSHPEEIGGKSGVPMGSMRKAKTDANDEDDEDDTITKPHVYGLPPGLSVPERVSEEDTEYHGAGKGPHIHFAGDSRERADSRTSSLAPPRPPPHVQGTAGQGKRQFSFHNVFNRNRSSTVDSQGGDDRPISRGALSFVSRASSYARHDNTPYPTGTNTTEEERLGLVTRDGSMDNRRLGDSTLEEEPSEYNSARRRSSDEWQITSGTSSSPEALGGSGDLGRQRTRDPYASYSEDDDLDEPVRSPTTEDVRRGNRSGAFV